MRGTLTSWTDDVDSDPLRSTVKSSCFSEAKNRMSRGAICVCGESGIDLRGNIFVGKYIRGERAYCMGSRAG